MSQLPEIGKMAPTFRLPDQKGKEVDLKAFRGEKNVVLYFYPKAMTPGCTVQACAIRDHKRKFSARDTVVLAVSPDSPARLEKFTDKESLNFTLLGDEAHEVAEKYGVWQKKKNYGREYMGIVRSTFIIGKDGKVKHVMPKVNTKTHHEDVLGWIKDNLSE